MKKLLGLILILTGICISSFSQTTISKSFSTKGDATWTVPNCVTSVTIEVWGGGGAGGGATGYPSYGGGGSAGAYTRGVFTVTPGSTINLHVGAGGASSLTATNNGEASWVFSNTTILAVGGNGAPGNVSGNGAGAAAVTSGNINTGSSVANYYGGAGYAGSSSRSGSGGGSPGGGGNGGNATSSSGGAAGAAGSYSAGAAGATGKTSSGVGSSGSSPGSGGAGGYRNSILFSYAGGAGADGKVIIYYSFGSFCIPTASNYSGTYFSIISTSGANTNFSNSSTYSTIGYTNYYCTTGASVYTGTSFSLNMTITGGKAGVAAFIDWNDDNSFSSSERVYFSGGYASGSISATITIPSDATTGTHRFRVVEDYYTSSPAACSFTSSGGTTRGEAEDYFINVTQMPVCSGTPFISSVSATPSSGPNGSNATLSASVSLASGLSYQWYTSTSSTGPWTAITVATTNPAYASQADNTTMYYHLVVTCANSGLSATSASVSYTTTGSATYCTPTVTYKDDEVVITNVSFVGTLNDVSNNSGTNTDAYQDFTANTLSYQEQGEAVNLNVVSNTASTLWQAWVDWNRDGDFNDSGEEVYNSNNYHAFSTSFGFQIPFSQPIGNYRIRIRTWDYINTYTGNPEYGGTTGSAMTPCGNLDDGQTEDYLFTVISRCNAGIDSTKSDTACVTGSAVFTLSAYGNAQATGFNWYSSEFSSSVIATGATFTTPSLSATTSYWVAATGLNTAGVACEGQIRAPAIAFKPSVPTISFDQPDTSYLCNGDNLSVTGSSGTVTTYLIKEGFEDGTLGEFTESTVNESDASQPWQTHTSIFTPTTTAVWRPAISSGFGTNNFISALGNVASVSDEMVSTLTSATHNTTGFSSLYLDFKLYYDHYLTDNSNVSLDNITVEAYDGSTWNTLQQTGADAGKASNMTTLTYSLGSQYLNKTNVQVRFTYNAQLNLSDGVAIDSIRLYGDHLASSSYTWTQVGGYMDNTASCLYLTDNVTDTSGNAYAGTSTPSLYLFPTDAQVDNGSPLRFEARLDLSNGCTARDTITVDINDKIWTAGAGTDNWSTGPNWCGNQVPKAVDRVSIPYLGTGGIYPVIKINNTGKSKFLNIDSGASVTIDPGGMLQIKRDLFTSIGASFTNNGTLRMDGIKNGVAQNFPGPGTIAEMNNLTIGNSGNEPSGSSNVILNAPISIRGKLYDSVGSFEFGNNDITLKSYSTGTAYVGSFDNSSAKINYTGTGRFIVERFIPARRAWRYLSTPMYSSTQTINDAWQEGRQNTSAPTTCPVSTEPKGYGMYITNTQPPQNGYDWNTTNNASLKVWQNNAWSAPSGTNIPITNYPAYCVFVRGDRQVCIQYATWATPDTTVLRVRGVLNEPGTSSFSYNSAFTQSYTGNPGDYIFVGNPYASPVDLTTVLSSSRSTGIVPDKAWFWDPTANGPANYNVGGYIVYAGGIWNLPNSSTYPHDLTLRSGEAFFVQMDSSSSSANINFKQSDKNTGSETNVFGFQKEKKQKSQPSVLYLNLISNINGNSALVDGVASAFGNGYSAKVDDRDAAKMWNIDENVAIFRDGKYLAIEFRPIPVLSDTIFYKMYLRKPQSYSLQVFTQNLPDMQPQRAWLVDKYLNTKTEINLQDTMLYNFMTDMDTNSYRNRFMVVFSRQLSTTPTPVSRASNQKDPNTSGIAAGAGIMEGDISIAPNPVTSASNAMLRFGNITKGNYEISVYNSKGVKLAVDKIQHGGSPAVYHLPQGNSSWSAGLYVVRIFNEETGESVKLKLIINR